MFLSLNINIFNIVLKQLFYCRAGDKSTNYAGSPKRFWPILKFSHLKIVKIIKNIIVGV